MTFSTEDSKKIAKLARIRVTDEEASLYAKEIGGILKWVEMLGEVDTGSVSDVASVVEHALPLREDKVTDGGYPEKVLANAPRKEFDCFVVPKVIGES